MRALCHRGSIGDFINCRDLEVFSLALSGRIVGTVAAIVASSFSVPLLGVGVAFAVVSFIASVFLDEVDSSYGVSDTLVEKLKEVTN